MNLDKKKTIVASIIFFSSFSFFLSFIINFSFARYLSRDLFGLVSFTQNLSNILLIVFFGSITLSYLKILNKIDLKKYNYILKKYIELNLFFSIVILISFSFINFTDFLTPRTQLISMIILIILPVSSIECYILFYKKRNNFFKINFLSSIVNVVKFFLIIPIFFFDSNINDKILFYYFYILYLILFFIILQQHLSFDYQIKKIKKNFFNFIIRVSKKTLPFLFYMILHYLFYSTDLIFLKIFGTLENISNYYLAFLIFNIFMMPFAAVYQKYFMNYIFLWSLKKNKSLFIFFKSYFLVLILGLFGVLIIIFFSKNFLIIMDLNKYNDALFLIYIFSLNIPIVYLSTHFGLFLNLKKNIYIKVKIALIAVIINIILNFLLVPEFLELGSVISTLITNFILTVLFYIFSKKIIIKLKK